MGGPERVVAGGRGCAARLTVLATEGGAPTPCTSWGHRHCFPPTCARAFPVCVSGAEGGTATGACHAIAHACRERNVGGGRAWGKRGGRRGEGTTVVPRSDCCGVARLVSLRGVTQPRSLVGGTRLEPRGVDTVAGRGVSAASGAGGC